MQEEKLQAFPPVFWLISNLAFDIFCRPLFTDKRNMSLLNPSGRLSKVENGDKVFQIQTEFYHRPARRITTTVILNGKTLNKIDTPWTEELLTDDDLKKIEKALRQQHQSVTQRIERREKKPDTPRPEEDSWVRICSSLSQADGVENLVVIDTRGEVLQEQGQFLEKEEILRIASGAVGLARFLSQSTNLGKLLGGQMKLRGERAGWLVREDKIFIARLQEKTGWEVFLEKAEQVGVEKKVE